MSTQSLFQTILLSAVAIAAGFGFFSFVRMLGKDLPSWQIVRLPRAHRLVFLFLTVFALFTAVPKTTNETGRANAPVRSRPALAPFVQSDDESSGSEADALRFSSISVDFPNNISFSVHVPDDQSDPRFDLFTRARLDEGGWEFFELGDMK